MSEKRYRGKEIDVTFDLRRCIHAAECGKRLQVVFDTSKRPWAQPDNASAAEVADTINHCPSGALKYERHDGGPAEAAPDVNTILITDSGEYQIHGDVTVTSLDGTVIASEYRLTLCRCGESANKPFCDNSHKKARFTAPSFVRDNSTVTENHPSGGPLKGGRDQRWPSAVTGPV